MKINDDFTQRAVVHSADADWIASPLAGVERKMLDRIGDEVARATTIVRYQAGSHFSAHTHSGGEEFIVLDGVFQDEHGDYPVGSYVRNPPSSHHRPSAEKGCTIFVKLNQFALTDRTPTRIDTTKIGAIPSAQYAGVSITPLFSDARETVQIQHIEPNCTFTTPDQHSGYEMLVLTGSLQSDSDNFVRHSWLRLPPNDSETFVAGADGASIWVKQNHLSEQAMQTEAFVQLGLTEK